ncbi:hypothetical protein RJ40_04450 [Methanofollis aquaemaris]|uniref:Lipoprotein n=1 Tax=Methanofollis aquaemaris TaxID=126734 RepID=A0A8A3S3U1_9EURY|nr:hypothetical protein [Methanofollis aquaemaris]QSZ66795.1 hypothetical protein RJ40_04450 [Methanofollis aquaemaris]
MKTVPFFLALAFVAVAAIFAGCTGTSPEATPTPTPVQTTTVAPIETTPAPSIQPEPTDEMPTNYQVKASARKDSIYNTITVTFAGGMGQENVKEIKVTVTRSDGTTETQTMTKPSGKSLSTGESVEFAGTAKQDRIQVWATMDRPLGADGKTVFKIYDSALPLE